MFLGRDFASEVLVANSLVPAVRTSSGNGTGVDMNDTAPEFTGILSVGAVSGTSPTLDVTFEESADNSTFTAISGASLTQVTAATKIHAATFIRSKRYVRAVATLAGTSPSFASSVTLQAVKKSY